MCTKEQAVRETVLARRSIRSYMPGKTIEKEKILKLLEAGMAAPSACNLQPWEFIVINEEAGLKKLSDTVEQGAHNAPMAMIICGNTKNIPWGGENWKIDCSAAVENMMLTATAMELGSVWIGSFDESAVRELFCIPNNIGVMSVVYFGYPSETKLAKTRYNEESVFWQKYDSERARTLRTIDMLGDASTTE